MISYKEFCGRLDESIRDRGGYIDINDEKPKPFVLLVVKDSKGRTNGAGKVIFDGKKFSCDLGHNSYADLNDVVGWKYLEDALHPWRIDHEIPKS